MVRFSSSHSFSVNELGREAESRVSRIHKEPESRTKRVSRLICAQSRRVAGEKKVELQLEAAVFRAVPLGPAESPNGHWGRREGQET